MRALPEARLQAASAEEPRAMRHPFLDLPPLAPPQRPRAPAGVQRASQPVLLARPGRRRPATMLESDDTRVMLEALRQLGCGIGAGDDVRASPAGSPAISATPARYARSPQRGAAVGGAGAAASSSPAFPRSARAADLRRRPPSARCATHGCVVEDWAHGLPPLQVAWRAARLERRSASAAMSSQFLTALLLALPLVAQGPIGRRRGRRRADLKPMPRSRATCCGASASGRRRRVAALHDRATAGRLPLAGDDPRRGDASSASRCHRRRARPTERGRARIEGVDARSIEATSPSPRRPRRWGGSPKMAGPGSGRRAGAGARRSDWIATTSRTRRLTLAVMALFADGTTRLTNIRAGGSETDRIAAWRELHTGARASRSGADAHRDHAPAPGS